MYTRQDAGYKNALRHVAPYAVVFYFTIYYTIL